MEILGEDSGLFEKIINNIHSAVMVLNHNKEVLYANSSIGNVFNVNVNQKFPIKDKSCNLTNCTDKDIVNCSNCALHETIVQLIKTDDPNLVINGEYEFFSVDKKFRYLEYKALNLYKNGEKLIFIAFNDISEKQELYKSIERANIELEEKCKQLEIKNFRLNQLTNSLEDSDSIILSIANTVEAKDKLTRGHISRVGFYTKKIGEQLCLSPEELEILRKGAILHDIGKIGIPDEILNKPGALNEAEWEIMKTHVLIADKILKPLNTFTQIKKIATQHHERLDGSGYPYGLKGDELDIFTRIVAVVDIYDALTTKRPYKEAFSKETAFEILDDYVRKGYVDREVVAALKRVPLDLTP